MPIATVVIPVAPTHQHLVDAAIASVRAQTVFTDVVAYLDKHQRGAGAARNQGAANVDSPFITFLDADDTLEPTYIERCLDAYTKGHYVYTGWTMGGVNVMPLAHTPFMPKHVHLVTTLIPTVAFRAVGGFDELLPGYEDVDLHLKLIREYVCGTLVPEYLVHYKGQGARSRAFETNPDKQNIIDVVYYRNGGERTIMCCGQEVTPIPVDPGAKQEGDVLAIAQWSGIQSMASSDGARIYRGGNWSQIWVSPKDIEARPDLFKRTFTVADLTPDKGDVLKESGLL